MLLLTMMLLSYYHSAEMMWHKFSYHGELFIVLFCMVKTHAFCIFIDFFVEIKNAGSIIL